jgi:glutathione S-transferase
MTIQLYAFDTPNGRKISVALEEMQLPYAVHVVDITAGEQMAPEFLRISPNNKIPAIVDPEGPDGLPISVFESGAILMYLAEKSGRFLPADLRGRTAVMEWLMFQMSGFGPAPGQVHHFVALASEEDRRYGLTRFMAESLNDVVTLQLSLQKNLDETEAALIQQSRLNRDLQQGLMSVRLVPLGNLQDPASAQVQAVVLMVISSIVGGFYIATMVKSSAGAR